MTLRRVAWVWRSRIAWILNTNEYTPIAVWLLALAFHYYFDVSTNEYSPIDVGMLPVSPPRQGFLSSAMKNYLSLLGWNDGTEKEIFTEEELHEAFDLRRVVKSSAVFDMTKLK